MVSNTKTALLRILICTNPCIDKVFGPAENPLIFK